MLGGVAGGRITTGVGANLLGIHSTDKNADATVYVGGIDSQATEELIWELFVQAGPVVSVYLPKDRVTNNHQGYGFVEFKSEEDSDYALKILNMIKLYGKPLRVNKAATDKTLQDVGANLFIGNLDPDVDETLLYNTFSAFGVVVGNPKIMRDPETGVSKGFGFISFDDFEASDAAIESMNGQFLGGRPISVTYAYKKDTKGERHGTPAERLLAAQRKSKTSSAARPHTMFATGPQQQPQPGIDIQAPVGAMGMSGFAAGMPPPPPHMMLMGGMGYGGMMPPPPPPPMWGGHPGGIPHVYGGVTPPPPPMQGYNSVPPPPPHGGFAAGGNIPPPPPPPPGGGAGVPPPPPPSSTINNAPPPPPPPPA